MKVPSIHFMRESTRAWFREARTVKDYSFFDALHGYVYGRWPFFYIAVGTGEHRLSRWLGPLATWFIVKFTGRKEEPNPLEQADHPPAASAAGMAFAHTYHGKVVPLEAAKQLVSIKQEVRITNLEKVIPYDRARDIIMHDPDHIVLLDCPCRVARAHPCLPLDVCLIIGEPFASFTAEHQPGRSRRITSEEAIEVLKAEDKRGHVHHAFFKDAMLGRFYAICNCCDCCCGAMQAHKNGTPMLASSGYRALVDDERCNACGLCARMCQFHAITVNGHASIDPDRCMGCGICVNKCKHAAITLQRDASLGEPLGEPLEIQKLMSMV